MKREIELDGKRILQKVYNETIYNGVRMYNYKTIAEFEYESDAKICFNILKGVS